MDPDTASTAPDTGTVIPNTEPAAEKPNYESTNDLDFEMTPEQEQAFVNSTLGIPEPAKEAPKDDNKADDGTVKPVGEEPKTPEVLPAEPDTLTAPEPATPPAPEPAKVEEPEPAPADGTVDTSDLWIEVENSEGQTTKITLDGGLPDDFKFKSDKQLYEIVESMQEMKGLRDERLAEAETKSEQQAQKQSQDNQLVAWENETQTLIDANIIPAPKLKAPANGKQFTPEEIESDPSLKLQNEVYGFMKTENDKRVAEGKPAIMSFGTMYNIYNEQQKTAAEAEKKAEEAKLVKERGALVGGTSAASGGEKAVYKAGSYSSIWGVPVDV